VEGGLAGIGTEVEGGLERVGTAAEGWLCGLSSSRTLQAPSWFTVLEVGAARLHTAHTCIRLCTMSKMSNFMAQTHTCVCITLGYTRVFVCMCVCFALSVG